MKKYSEREERVEWKPSLAEVQDLSAKLKPFTIKEINSILQTPFFQFLEKENVISFSEKGQIQVINPFQYTRWNKIDSLRQYIESKELERVLEQFPEERALYQEKVNGWMQSCREVLRGMKV